MGPINVFIKEIDVVVLAWIITIEDENSILVHSNKTNTNQGWSTKECMVVLVQMQASIIKH
jgi:hypothetical protein